jgi:hypothetical protein
MCDGKCAYETVCEEIEHKEGRTPCEIARGVKREIKGGK